MLACTRLALHKGKEMSEKIYGDRDLMAMDRAGNHYCRHVDHMTSESLHSKSDIAAELGWRDMQIDALQQKLDAVLAENVMLKNGIGFFSYSPDSGLEEHDSAEEAIEVARIEIGCYRDNACDGWAEEVEQVVWGVILQRATMTDLRSVNEDDNCAEWAEEWCDYTLLPNLSTPATDALLNAVRADAIDSAAEKAGQYAQQLKVGADGWHKWKLAVMFLVGEAQSLRAETDTTPSQYESLAGGK